MRYMLDTDHCSPLQRGYTSVVQHFQSLPSDAEVVTSVVTQGELLIGVHQATTLQRQTELRSLYDWLMTNISDILPITTEVASLFASYICGLEEQGQTYPHQRYLDCCHRFGERVHPRQQRRALSVH